MTLIAMAVYDTEENGRTWMTKETVNCILNTHTLEGDGYRRLFIINNGSCKKTVDYLNGLNHPNITVIHNKENVGTARAINQGWALRDPGEHCVKMDNDVEIDHEYWIDEMEEAIAREPKIGIVGLKRPDCWETPWHENSWYRSELMMLPHKENEPWIIIEKVNHVMGTCQMYNSRLLDRIGYLYQMGGLYGFDDALASVRSQVAGFINVFLPHIRMRTIDPGGDTYTEWKIKYGNKMMDDFNNTKKAYMLRYIDIYHGVDDE